MKELQDFFLDNCIPTLVFFIQKHAMQKNCVVNPFFTHPVLCMVAVVLLNFLENV